MGKYSKLLVIVLLACMLTGGAHAATSKINTQASPVKQELATETAEQFAQRYSDARLAVLCVGACAGTYKPAGEAKEYPFLTERGWKIQNFTTKHEGVEANFTFAKSPVLPSGKRYGILAFRGSSSPDDWRVNFRYQMVPYGGKSEAEFASVASTKVKEEKTTPMVHKGFHQYAMAALAATEDFAGEGKKENILAFLKAHPDITFVVTGHSLGGAAAILTAERLVALGVAKERIPVITFGAPAVGNAAFAQSYGDKIDHLRVRTSKDLVTGVLRHAGDYTQFGRELLYRISAVDSDFQHVLPVYYDYSIKHFYDVYDAGVKRGFITPLAATDKGKGPLVALYVDGSLKGIRESYAPNLMRFLLGLYTDYLPRYVLLKGQNIQDELDIRPLVEAAQKVGADYVVSVNLNYKQIREREGWYMELSQVLYDVKHSQLLGAIHSNSKGDNLEKGYLQTTLQCASVCHKELRGLRGDEG